MLYQSGKNIFRKNNQNLILIETQDLNNSILHWSLQLSGCTQAGKAKLKVGVPNVFGFSSLLTPHCRISAYFSGRIVLALC
jgi:hypothetical protein